MRKLWLPRSQYRRGPSLGAGGRSARHFFKSIGMLTVFCALVAASLAILATPSLATPVVPAYIQGNSSYVIPAATSIALSFNSANTAGNLIVVSATYDDGTGMHNTTCSDSQSNTYVNVTKAWRPGNNQSVATCYAANVNAGSNTVTVTFDTSLGYRGILISEYSGVAISNPVDAYVSNQNVATTATDDVTSTAQTTSTNGDLIYGAVWVSLPVAGTGFTSRLVDPGDRLLTEDRIQTTAGSVTAYATSITGGGYAMNMVAFRPLGETSNVTVTTTIDPSFTFSTTGRSSTCNGQSATNFQTGSTASAVGVGHLSAGAQGGGAQDLAVTTNAGGGFLVYIRTSGATPNSLSDGSGHTIADVSGTNASPGAAPTAGAAGFGYTSSDASTPFTSNTWAKLTNANASVLIGSAGTGSKTRCVGYQVALAASTPAASYSSNVIYTAVPSF